MQRAVDAGAFVALSYRQWSALTMEDARFIHGVNGVQVYNHGFVVESDKLDRISLRDRLLS